MIDYRTPLIEIEPGDIRQAAIANALQATNRRAAISEHEFRDLLPRPPKGSQWDLDRMFRIIQLGDGKIRTEGTSTCGLVASTLLGRVLSLPWEGFDYWRYPLPYNRRDGSGLDIVSCLGVLGDECKAKRATGERGRPGDVVCIGSGYKTHVLTLIDDDGTNVTSVDGGQVDDAAHRFLQCTRTCKRLLDGMRVVWILDLDELARALPRASWTVPEGYSEVVVPEPPKIKTCWQLGTVKGYQAALAKLGYYKGKVDGLAWGQTQAAVRAFQADHALVVDGVVGRMTRAALQREVDAVEGERLGLTAIPEIQSSPRRPA